MKHYYHLMTMWQNVNAEIDAEIKEKKITILLFMVYLTLIMEVLKLILKMTLKYITVKKLQKSKNMGWKSSLKNLRKYRGCRKR